MPPLGGLEFAAQMARLGPFESAPLMAAAVSGGADSMALCLLAADWLRAHGGRLVALSVDHGLRANSAAEARWVCEQLHAYGIPCQVLPWNSGKPATGIQQKARAARYERLLGYCREHSIPYLLLGHHASDQAETVLMRMWRGSGVDGLAAMQGLTITPHVLLLRPLLHIEAERLTATLRRRNQKWLDDPSNRDRRFLRAAVRAALAEGDNLGVCATDAVKVANKAAKARQAIDQAVSELLSRCCRVSTTGMARVEPGALATAAAEIGWRALGRIIACIGGAAWPPSRAATMRRIYALRSPVREPLGNLGRCRFVWQAAHLMVCREKRHLPVPQFLAAGQSMIWDNRFRLRIPSSLTRPAGRFRVMPLDDDMWTDIVSLRPEVLQQKIPKEARCALPAVVDDEGVFAVPNVGYTRDKVDETAFSHAWIAFRPRRTLTGTSAFLAVAR